MQTLKTTLLCFQVEGVKPLATPDDCFEAEDICKADAEVRSGEHVSR